MKTRKKNLATFTAGGNFAQKKLFFCFLPYTCCLVRNVHLIFFEYFFQVTQQYIWQLPSFEEVEFPSISGTNCSSVVLGWYGRALKVTQKEKIKVMRLRSEFNEFGTFSSIIQDVSFPTLIKLSLTRRTLHVNVVTFNHPVFLHLAQILK